MVEGKAQRGLGHGAALCQERQFRQPPEGAHRVGVRESLVAHVVGGHLPVGEVLAAEHALRQRHPDQGSHAGAARVVEGVRPLPFDEVIAHLQHVHVAERREPAYRGQVVAGDADQADQAAPLQVHERLHHGGFRTGKGKRMELIHVDVAAIETPQARLRGRVDAPPRGFRQIRHRRRQAEVGGDLGCGQPLVAAPAQGTPHDPLAVAVAIRLGTVDQVDAQLLGAVDQRHRLRIAGAAPADAPAPRIGGVAGQRKRADTHLRNTHPAGAKFPIPHRRTSL